MSDGGSFFLSVEEVRVLTGIKLPRRQAQWLQEHGWRFIVNANRQPIIARKYAEKMLGCGDAEFEERPQPNFRALRAV